MVAVSTVILALFTTAALSAASVSAGQVLLAISGLLFGYIVVRLSQSLFAAGAAHRRRARRELILAAAVPALVLTPTVIGSSPPGFTSTILLSSVVWLALAMSYTSYILAKATRSVPMTQKPNAGGSAAEGVARSSAVSRTFVTNPPPPFSAIGRTRWPARRK
jgi:hypothetical protein